MSSYSFVCWPFALSVAHPLSLALSQFLHACPPARPGGRAGGKRAGCLAMSTSRSFSWFIASWLSCIVFHEVFHEANVEPYPSRVHALLSATRSDAYSDMHTLSMQPATSVCSLALAEIATETWSPTKQFGRSRLHLVVPVCIEERGQVT